MGRTWRWVAAGGFVLLTAFALWWVVGTSFLTPERKAIDTAGFPAGGQEVVLEGRSGRIVGWLRGDAATARCVLLAHGLGGNRVSMLDRAEFFAKKGFAMLSIDLRAHGESDGDWYALGYLEQHDISTAVGWLRERGCPKGIVVNGFSLGAASTLLSAPEHGADALILEAAFPTLEAAILHRMETLFGDFAASLLTPVLTPQIPLRLGFSLDDVRPIDVAPRVTTPTLVIGGASDPRALPEETRAIEAALAGPSALWLVPDAPHTDLHDFAPEAWEERVDAFLAETFPGEASPSVEPAISGEPSAR